MHILVHSHVLAYGPAMQSGMSNAGPGSETTWDSQSTAVFPFQAENGQELLMYMGDRWNAAGPGSVSQASYVWLPLLPVPAPSQHSSGLDAAVRMQLQAHEPASQMHQLQYSAAPGPQAYIDGRKQGSADTMRDPRRMDEIAEDSFGGAAPTWYWWGWWRAVLKAVISTAARNLRMKEAARNAVALLLQQGCRMLDNAGYPCHSSSCYENAETFTLVFKSSWRLRDFLSPANSQRLSLGNF